MGDELARQTSQAQSLQSREEDAIRRRYLAGPAAKRQKREDEDVGATSKFTLGKR